MTYIISLQLIPNIGQNDHLAPYEMLTLYEHKWYSNPWNCIPSPPTFALSVDGNLHAFPWLGDYYLILESMCA